MFQSATYKPDQMITAGSAWAKRQGIPNHCFTVRRVGNHAHVINTMFDHANLAAVVVEGTCEYASEVILTNRCQVCQPLIYTMSYTHPSGKFGSVCTTNREHLDQMARNALRLNLTNIEVRDDTGRDVTFKIKAFCE